MNLIIKKKSIFNHKWTDDELEIVRRDYRGTSESVADIAERLNVSFYGVKGQIEKMGITRVKKHNWTAKEEAYLRENIQKLPLHLIGRRLNIPTGAVIVKSKKMHLYRAPRDGWYTKRDVCEILGIDHKKVQSYIDCGALKATYHNGHKPAKNGMAMWHIGEKDLRGFIINYSFELVGRNVDLFQIVQLLTSMYSFSPGGEIKE